MWNLPIASLSIGPEIYVSQGNRSSTFRFTYIDPLALERRVYSSTIKRKDSYGFLIRGGYNFCSDFLGGDYFSYLSVGADYGNFSIDRSFTKDSNAPDTNTSVVHKKKSFLGLLLGIGLEKRISSYKVGIDLRCIRYGKKSFSDLIPNTAGLPETTQSILDYTGQPRIYSVSVRLSYLF